MITFLAACARTYADFILFYFNFYLIFFFPIAVVL